MDCEKQLSLVIYDEDTSKQKSSSVSEKKSSQTTNKFSFSSISLDTKDASTLEKVIPVHSHKYSRKDIMTAR